MVWKLIAKVAKKRNSNKYMIIDCGASERVGMNIELLSTITEVNEVQVELVDGITMKPKHNATF